MSVFWKKKKNRFTTVMHILEQEAGGDGLERAEGLQSHFPLISKPYGWVSLIVKAVHCIWQRATGEMRSNVAGSVLW